MTMKTWTATASALVLSLLSLTACGSDKETGGAGPRNTDQTAPKSEGEGDGGSSGGDDSNGDGETDGETIPLEEGGDPTGAFTTDEPYEVHITAYPAPTQPPRGYDGQRWLEDTTTFDDKNGQFRDFSEEEMDDVDKVVELIMTNSNDPGPACTGVETFTIIFSQDDNLYHEETVGSCQDGGQFEMVSGLYVMFGSH